VGALSPNARPGGRPSGGFLLAQFPWSGGPTPEATSTTQRTIAKCPVVTDTKLKKIVCATNAGTDEHISPISTPSHTIAWFFSVTRSPMRAPVSTKAWSPMLQSRRSRPPS
jgi:hypothetical protein